MTLLDKLIKLRTEAENKEGNGRDELDAYFAAWDEIWSELDRIIKEEQANDVTR
jgi:hypothetical protein